MLLLKGLDSVSSTLTQLSDTLNSAQKVFIQFCLLVLHICALLLEGSSQYTRN